MSETTDLGVNETQQKDVETQEEVTQDLTAKEPEEQENETTQELDDERDEAQSREEVETDLDNSEPEQDQEPEGRTFEVIQSEFEEYDKKTQDSLQTLKDEWKDTESNYSYIEQKIKNPILAHGRPAFLMPEDEFEKLEDSILDSGDKEKIQALRQARKERREYQKELAQLAPRAERINKKREKQNTEEIQKIKEAYKSLNPAYENYFQEMEQGLVDEFKANPAKLERFVWGGLRDKSRMIDQFLEDSGIKAKVEKESQANNRPNLAVPVGAGKGKRNTPPGKSKKRVYTRQEISVLTKNGLSDELEKEIDQAMMEGRIK